MSTSLGLYIEENIIKYAKVSKERDQIKVEAFGVKVYENFNQAIKQIIEETYSYKTPISINLSKEMYNFFQVFTLLNKKDMPKAIKTEFETYCAEKNYNPNSFESRYAVTENPQNDDKLKVIYVSANKNEINKKIQSLNGFNIQNITPLSIAIGNIKKTEENENALIVNIEEDTTITTILNQKIFDVQKIEFGMKEVLEKINMKENSLQKSYETCKETTIYTSEGKELTEEETGHLEEIMPTLHEVVGQIRKNLNSSIEKIKKVYITGTGALINNIDLYFEEYLEDVRCEILKPDFVKISPEINIKDYIEVNSAIALALSALGEGVRGMNFKKANMSENINNILKMDASQLKNIKIFNNAKGFSLDLSAPLDKIEKQMIRGLSGVLVLIFVFCIFSTIIKQQTQKKMNEATDSIDNTQSQISLVNQDIQKLQAETNKFSERIKNLEDINGKLQENNRMKKSIPNLLNSLMYVIPEEVQITSIQNTSSLHVEINAKSSSYAQLGYLTASIKTSGILNNVISTSGQKENNYITIKIEGDLP